jgi:hypothetical protein
MHLLGSTVYRTTIPQLPIAKKLAVNPDRGYLGILRSLIFLSLRQMIRVKKALLGLFLL